MTKAAPRSKAKGGRPAKQARGGPSPVPVSRLRRWFRWIGVVAVALLLVGVGLAWPILARPPLVLGQDAISTAATTAVTPVLEEAGGRVIVVRPPAGVPDTEQLVVLYPGGLVRPQAYEWLARRLAAAGVLTVIPEFSFDLAVTDPGRANQLISRYGTGRTVVLAGHSLGGAMAVQYLVGQAEFGRSSAAGLILMGAYPASGADLSGSSVQVLSLVGEHDTVVKADALEAGWALLPSATRRVVVPGSVHSFFGRYGPQGGDGVPTVSRVTAENTIAASILDFLAALG